MPKRTDEGLPVNLVFRVSEADAARLDALAALLPTMGKAGIAREALRRGLEAFDVALAERDETARLAALARVLGMAPPAQRKRE